MVETNLETVRNPMNLFVGGCQRNYPGKELEYCFCAPEAPGPKNDLCDTIMTKTDRQKYIIIKHV